MSDRKYERPTVPAECRSVPHLDTDKAPSPGQLLCKAHGKMAWDDSTVGLRGLKPEEKGLPCEACATGWLPTVRTERVIRMVPA